MRLRQAVIFLLISIFLSFKGVSAAAAPDKELQPLKEKYSDYFMLGNAASLDEMAPGSESLEILTKHFDAVTPKSVLLPEELVSATGEYTFDKADEFVKSAKENNLKVIGRTLVRYDKTPEWLNINVTREEAIENLQNYIRTVVSHFGDDIYSWDVVTEAFYDQIIDPANWRQSLRQNPWYTAIGADYINIAFTTAKEANPNVKLYYNDYFLEDPAKGEAIFNMVKELKEAGVPIDGVGMQGRHGASVNLKNIEDALRRFSELDVALCISELKQPQINPFTPERELKQGYRYAQLFEIFKKYSSKIERITLWGLNDTPENNNSTLFTEMFIPKFAYYALHDTAGFIKANPNAAEVKAYKQFTKAEYGTPAIIFGRLDSLWERTQTFKVRNYLTDWQGADAMVRVLWNEQFLYVLAEVEDKELDNSSHDPFKQDSVTVFINEDYPNFSPNGGSMYTVNFVNDQTFGQNSNYENGFISSAYKTETGYTVQMLIPFKSKKPQHNDIIGFDIQINDAEFGDIISTARWNDLSGLSPDTSRWGKLILQRNNNKYLAITEPREEIIVNSPIVMLRARIIVIFFSIIMMTAFYSFIYFSKKVKK